jgi:hypothetical protein
MSLKVFGTPSERQEHALQVGAAFYTVLGPPGASNLEIRVFENAAATCTSDFDGWGVKLTTKPSAPWTGGKQTFDAVDPEVFFPEKGKNAHKWLGGAGLEITSVEGGAITATITSHEMTGYFRGQVTAHACAR